jgi:hypothetical protein
MAVQHWEGGIVAEILTREGALVAAGTPLDAECVADAGRALADCCQ